MRTAIAGKTISRESGLPFTPKLAIQDTGYARGEDTRR